MSAYYCCEYECFEVPQDQVDGMACKTCEAFSFCHCKCRSYAQKHALTPRKNTTTAALTTSEEDCPCLYLEAFVVLYITMCYFTCLYFSYVGKCNKNDNST